MMWATMTLPRVIPKMVFQAIALLSLVPVLAVAVQLCLEDLPPYAWLTGLGGPLAWLLTVVLAVLAWVVLILPVRLLSTMPTLGEELDEAGAANLGALYAQQQQRLQADKRRNNARWHVMMALAGGLLAGIMGLIAVLFWFTEGTLLVALAIGAVVSGVLATWHVGQVLLRLLRPRVDRGG